MPEPNAVPRSALRYMPQLDGLRALAVLAVVWSHWMKDYTAGLPWGHFGVQLFFVLSGYLITGILVRAKPDEGASRLQAMKQFLIRRSLRIFPAYYAVLMLTWIGDCGDSRQQIVWNATYTSNIYLFWTLKFNALSHFWSLAVEEQFYLFWPWVVLWTRQSTLKWICGLMVALGPLFRIGMKTLLPATEPTVLMPGNLDALGIGAFLAIVAQEPVWLSKLRFVQRWIALPMFLAFQGYSFRMGRGLYGAAESIRELFMVIAFSGLVDQAARGFRGPIGWLLESRPLTSVGRISYGIYLIHNITPDLVYWLLDWSSLGHETFFVLPLAIQMGIFGITTLALAGMSWLWIEEPFLQWKDRFQAAESASPSRTVPV